MEDNTCFVWAKAFKTLQISDRKVQSSSKENLKTAKRDLMTKKTSETPVYKTSLKLALQGAET